MLKRSIVVAACAVVLAFAGTAQAQENATLVLKSGEQISGQLIDLGGVGFTIRVGGQDRNVPQSEVARIDFSTGGSPATNAQMANDLNSGKHVIQLRSGEVIAGNLYDIGGTTPLKITVDTPGGRRELSSSDVGRIYLSAQGSGVAATTGTTAAAQPSVPGAIVVPGNQQWVATGITVRRGERLGFNATGEVVLSADANDKAQPAGAYAQRKAPGSPLPMEFAGALIARVGNGEPFAIGGSTTVPMPASGPLYLGINDDGMADNSGQFNVVITRGRR
jgi:hypothetical protein